MKLLVSHDTRDAALAKRLVEVIENSVGVGIGDIRCTSLPGYKLPAGASIIDHLRSDLASAPAVYALVTENSLQSGWVQMELGASWVRSRQLVLLLCPPVVPQILPGPLSHVASLVMDADDASVDLEAALTDTARLLDTPTTFGRGSRARLRAFVEECLAASDRRPRRDVEFRCVSPEAFGASTIHVAGDFNNWLRGGEGRIRTQERFRLERDVRDGAEIFVGTLSVPIGQHDFKFVADGVRWIGWHPESGYPQGRDAPGGANLRADVS
jgi:hypothetical protein